MDLTDLLFSVDLEKLLNYLQDKCKETNTKYFILLDPPKWMVAIHMINKGRVTFGNNPDPGEPGWEVWEEGTDIKLVLTKAIQAAHSEVWS